MNKEKNQKVPNLINDIEFADAIITIPKNICGMVVTMIYERDEYDSKVIEMQTKSYDKTQINWLIKDNTNIKEASTTTKSYISKANKTNKTDDKIMEVID